MRKESFFVCLLVSLLSGCAGNNALTGAVVGAGIGTAVTLGDPAGTIIGGAAGLVIGAATDAQTSHSTITTTIGPSVYYEDIYQYNRPYYPARYPPPVRPGFAFDYYYYAPYGSYVDIVFVSGGRKYKQNWKHSDGRRISHRDVAYFRQHRHAGFSQQRNTAERNFSRQRPLRASSRQISHSNYPRQSRNIHQHSRTDARQGRTNVRREHQQRKKRDDR